jgi:hypothetical protein
VTRAFLSYTKADSAVAVRVAESLRAAGLAVFFWEDPENRGQRFVRQLRREIETADVFVVLLSPESLASRWCEREWDMAVHRETHEDKQGCRDCTWRHWCSGGCAAATFRATGRFDVRSPNCAIYRTIYPKAVRLEGLRLLRHAGR